MRYYELTDSLVIGRNSGDIQFPNDAKISGKHALIKLDRDESPFKITITDLESKNKTIVNRSEIPPNKKIEIKYLNLIEIGEQQFVLSETDNINLVFLNEMIKEQLNRPLSSISSNQKNDSLKQDNIFSNPALLADKENEIKMISNEISEIEKKTRLDVAALDNKKEMLIKEAKSQIFELSKQLKSLQLEVLSIKQEQDRLKADIEQKKKKIINLKDFDS